MFWKLHFPFKECLWTQYRSSQRKVVVLFWWLVTSSACLDLRSWFEELRVLFSAEAHISPKSGYVGRKAKVNEGNSKTNYSDHILRIKAQVYFKLFDSSLSSRKRIPWCCCCCFTERSWGKCSPDPSLPLTYSLGDSVILGLKALQFDPKIILFCYWMENKLEWPKVYLIWFFWLNILRGQK